MRNSSTKPIPIWLKEFDDPRFPETRVGYFRNKNGEELFCVTMTGKTDSGEPCYSTATFDVQTFARLAKMILTKEACDLFEHNGLSEAAAKHGYVLRSMSTLPGALGNFHNWMKAGCP